jgi:hypothetical protein
MMYGFADHHDAGALHMSLLLTRIATTLSLTNSLADGLSPDALQSRNGTAPSNTIGGQFWCIVGARESYARAFDLGTWQGFSCSLKDVSSPDAVLAALAVSKSQIEDRIEMVPPMIDDARMAILMDLLEHEAQHHGQLIRFFYANSLPFPADFARRYALG